MQARRPSRMNQRIWKARPPGLPPITLLLHAFMVAHLLAFPVLASPSQVTITTVSTPGDPSDEKWVAKKQGKVLWSENCIGPEVHDQTSGMTVLGSNDLLIIDRAGTIKNRLRLGAVNDPRALFLDGGYLVYDTGALAVAHYDPKSEGGHLWRWLKEVRRLHVYDVKAGHPLWEAPELSLGLPVALDGSKLETVRIVNFANCLQNPRTLPKVFLMETDVRTGKTQRYARLLVTQSEALNLLHDALGIERMEVSRVHWTATSVSIKGLFGRDYIGHRKHRVWAHAERSAT